MSTSETGSTPSARALAGEPRWLLSGLYAVLATAAVCWPAWPGMMSYDSLFAYEQARDGVTTMTWPPMHAYLFYLSRAAGADTWGLFLLQTFLLFFAGGLCINLLARRRGWAIAALAAYALGFVYVPELLGSATVQWRDVTTTSFTLAGLAAWLVAARYRTAWPLAAAALAFGVATALRYNTIVLLVPFMALMLWRPFLDAGPARRARAIAAASLAVALGLAWASTHWRLPDLKRTPGVPQFAATQQFDLIGISACADRTWLPPTLTSNWPMTPRQIRIAYDPRHLNRAFREIPGQPRILSQDPSREVSRIWPAAVKANPGCYLKHRAAVFVEQMGMARAGVFYPSNPDIIANPYGLTAAHPGAMARITSYIAVRSAEIWRRPFLVYLLAPLAVGVLWAARNRSRTLFLALLTGAYAYPAALFFAGPAADARYIFPSSVVCVLILSAGAAAFMSEAAATALQSAFSNTAKSRSRRKGRPIRASS
jgi:hypothetical protein